MRSSIALLALCLGTLGMTCKEGIEDSLNTLDKKENQKKLRNVLRVVDIRERAHDATEGLLDAVEERVSADSLGAGLETMIQGSIATAGRAATDAVGNVVEESVAAAGRTATDALETELGPAARELVRLLVRELNDELAHGVRDTLGPALETVLGAHVAAGLARTLESARPVLVATATDAATGVVTGIAAGITGDARLDRVDSILHTARDVAWIILAIAVTLVILVLVLGSTIVRGRRARSTTP